jgi:hypothetical protein
MALTHSLGISVGARLWEVFAITKHKEVAGRDIGHSNRQLIVVPELTSAESNETQDKYLC